MTSISVQKKRIRKRRDAKQMKARNAVVRKKEAKSESAKLLRTLARATGVTKKK